MLLQADTIRKSYTVGGQCVEILRGVSLSLDRGQSLALMGQSGSGKSTALHLLAGLDIPDTGRILLDGHELSVPSDASRAAARRDKIGIVFQQFNLVPSLTVSANIALQAQLAGRHDASWYSQLAERRGLTQHLGAYPEALSGGQQQRVAIARALASRPALVLADEPTGNLDDATSEHVLALLLEMTRETGTALLMVTHARAHAERLGSVLHLRDGVIA